MSNANTHSDRPGFTPSWPTPPGVRSFITTRYGGCSLGPYAGNNLALHVGDDKGAVARNREQLLLSLCQRQSLCQPSGDKTKPELTVQWLQQVHGNTVVAADSGGSVPPADGSFTTQRKLICGVLTADCLPILLCDVRGKQVAAVHAGWRGLVAGIIGQAITRFSVSAKELLAYIGPGICQRCYEVDQQVCNALLATVKQTEHSAVAHANTGNSNHYFISLAGIAREQLKTVGVAEIHGGEICNACDSRFYSYRRDRRQGAVETGRFAGLIWLD